MCKQKGGETQDALPIGNSRQKWGRGRRSDCYQF